LKYQRKEETSMGIFYTRPSPQPIVQNAIQNALETNPANVNVEEQAVARAHTVSEQLGATGEFQTGRFLVALAIIIAFIAAAIITEASNLPDSSKALWGLSATVLGVIVGLLGGESSA
jgi:hypothetical protein